MTQSDATPDESQPPFAVVFEGGRTLTCPAQPQLCTWVAIAVDGVEIHRLDADALQANPGAELTRLAEALIPGLPETPGLPQPEEHEEQEWHECAIAVAPTATRSASTRRRKLSRACGSASRTAQ
jgi:hypothetical protein